MKNCPLCKSGKEELLWDEVHKCLSCGCQYGKITLAHFLSYFSPIIRNSWKEERMPIPSFYFSFLLQ